MDSPPGDVADCPLRRRQATRAPLDAPCRRRRHAPPAVIRRFRSRLTCRPSCHAIASLAHAPGHCDQGGPRDERSRRTTPPRRRSPPSRHRQRLHRHSPPRRCRCLREWRPPSTRIRRMRRSRQQRHEPIERQPCNAADSWRRRRGGRLGFSDGRLAAPAGPRRAYAAATLRGWRVAARRRHARGRRRLCTCTPRCERDDKP
jgi:hypothetical protein